MSKWVWNKNRNAKINIDTSKIFTINPVSQDSQSIKGPYCIYFEDVYLLIDGSTIENAQKYIDEVTK
jgi:hypothetical protein